MTLRPWRTGEVTDAPEEGGARALAWEFARRNEALIADMARDDVDPDDIDAFAKWGLRFRG